jgi:signal transduction histidine kinase
VVSVFKKRQGAYILLLALLVTIVTSFFAEFKSVFFNNIAFTGADRPYLFGILAQMLILTVAARYQVQSLEKDFESIREEQRNLIEKKNDELKVQVEEKTKQLKDALKTLEQKKDQLETANQDLLLKSDSIQTLNQKLEQLVASRTQALQSTMHDLDTFLYRASHDLRRPLMTISGIVNLVMKEKKIDKIHELMLHVNKTVTGLDRMLKKLIAISFCYTEGIDKEPVEIVGLIQGVSRSIAHEYSLRENQIQVTAANPHVQLNSNAYLLKMIVDCLLENAVQYHSNGEVLITIVVENHGKACLIKIIDRGEGIESTRQRQIFDMFFRAHEKSDGNGLGLYLVKIGVEKLGGSVDLTSQLGQGTEIRLLF